jgi:double-stranded uracil-DNA glycosylase
MLRNNKIVDKALPDIISNDLKVLFVGFNPGLYSAQSGHHYARKNNRFWKLLFEAGLTPYKLEPFDDKKLLDFGYGSTNIVDRPTRNASEITAAEFNEGCKSLFKLILEINPKIVCYVGIGVYRIFCSNISGISQNRLKVETGLQKNNLVDTAADFVCSNPSGLNTIPYSEQLGCFSALKRLIDGIE